MPSDGMVRLVTLHDPFAAKVLAARLGAEGVVWELRGPVEGPYPGVGTVYVYVARPDEETAREVLSLAPLEADADDEDLDRERGGSAAGVRWGAVLCLAVLIGFVLLRWLAMLA